METMTINKIDSKSYQNLYNKMLRYTSSYVKTIQDAEDIVSNAISKVIYYSSFNHNKGSLEGYLFVSVRNEIINYYRSLKKTFYMDDLGEEFDVKDSSYDLEESFYYKQIIQKVNEIKDDDVHFLLEYISLTPKTALRNMSKKHKMNINTVKSKIHKTRKKLKNMLQDMLCE